MFHCWVLEKRQGEWWIYLQLRSLLKKDYPGDLDITAAGHIGAHETAEEGIREMDEELGIHVNYGELISLGVIPYCIHTKDIHDAEFAHVFLYKHSGTIEDFEIQREELDGLYATPLHDFLELIVGSVVSITVKGYKFVGDTRIDEVRSIMLNDLGTLPKDYLNPLKELIEKHIK
ncbi:isopentenyldiphosphate isomerase [Chryseomicrobium aureum]|uniref:NUDIX hydrolase n=1 Tax=Chryseomicrobium aureum TaxID=1441723 RepID=UPI0030841EC0|nr:isopentenyldiphosphate isomerase [Chryseomicrobium aureum]